ncbi:hypothetical protein R1flu_023379 [Riccia fluitans]|uniref:Uncharacterized protein n=1 Tax=Riccia fluitans TaxID=41844 RepID=A0ABD1XRV5_9MARC
MQQQTIRCSTQGTAEPMPKMRHFTPNYELPHDEAMEMIDRLVQGEETNSGDGAIVEKIPTLQSMAIQPVVPTRLPRPHTINFEELSLLTRDEVFPHLKFDRLKTKEILLIDGSVFGRGAAGPQGQLPINVSRLVIRQALKWIGRPSSSYTSTTLVLLALAEVDPGEPNLKPDLYAWVFDQISFRLNHTKQDKASIAKFREGWQAVVQLIHTRFLAQMGRQNQEEPRANPLLLGDELRNAFGDTHAQWDAERCELVCERTS